MSKILALLLLILAIPGLAQTKPVEVRPLAINNQCVYDSDCPNDLVCKWGQCVSVCKNSKDCKDGEFCAQKYRFGEVIPALFSTTICVKKVPKGEWADLSTNSLESFQIGSSYWGYDYANFPLKEENPQKCFQACKEDPRCQAWNYSASGSVAEAPYCSLKEKVGPKYNQSEFISGMILNR